MKKAILISNVDPHLAPNATSSRVERINDQIDYLEKKGWEQIVCEIPRGRFLISGIVRGLRLCIRNNIQVVHSISEPVHLHIAGLVISRLLNIPLIAHTRDSIVVNKPGLSSISLEYRFRKMAEKLIVNQADKVIWDDKGGLIPEGYYEKTYPKVNAEKFIRLPPIGYDPDNFEGASVFQFPDSTITFAGRFYESLEPYDFFEGLAEYTNKKDSPTICFHAFGDWDENYWTRCQELGISDSVEPHEWIPHEELVPRLKGSDVLLHIGGSEPGQKYHIGSKMFDYIGARSPILVIGDTDFEAAKLVERYDLGIAVSGKDPDAIANAIEKLLDPEYEFNPDEEVYDEFSRENRLSQLVEVFNDTLESSQVS